MSSPERQRRPGSSDLSEGSSCQSPHDAIGYSRECDQGQQSPARPALTSDLRQAVTRRVNNTGPPPARHGAPRGNGLYDILINPFKVDADGVALAAIQGLTQMMQEEDVKIQALETRLAEVEKVLQTLAQKQNGGAR